MLEGTYTGKDRFLNLFYDPVLSGFALSPKTQLSLFILRIDGGRFDYDAMYRELGNASIAYVLSRSQYSGYTKENAHQTVRYVQGRFRNADVNDGEGGELLLYCFLEAHLGAPKILSKMELKTASNNYVNGSDGVHLLDLGGDSYHLIFGESKMISDSTIKGSSFRKAIADAFKSIKKVEEQGLVDEVQLIDSNLMKEAFDESAIAQLKAILIPSARKSSVKKQNAFGIFVGFEIDTTDWDVIDMSEQEFEDRIKSEVQAATEEKYDYIRNKIIEHGLAGYHFYIYAVPFIKDGSTDIDKTRKQIIGQI